MIDDARDFIMLIKSGLLAAFGGVVGYLVDVTHHRREFSWMAYASFVLVAFFVGQVLDNWLPTDMPGRGGVLMTAGTAAYPILTMLQGHVTALVEKMR
jgi:hypothetical protein